MANEQIIQNGLIVGRAAGAAIIVVPTENSTSTILFDDRSGGETSEIKFDHLTNIYTHKIGTTTQFQITSTGVTVAGDLTVNGTTTTINATNLNITDNVIIVNSSEAGAGVTAGTAGIEVERGSLANTSWLFDETNDWWSPSGVTQTIGNIAIIDSSLASEQVLTISSTGAIMLPSGTTGERPATPIAGMIRYNTTTVAPEVYSSAIWNTIIAASATTTTRGYINGLILSNGTDASHDINISIGVAKDDSDTDNMELTSIYVKQLDAPWVVGTAVGGNDQLQIDGAQTVTFTDNGASDDFVTIDSGTWIGSGSIGDTLVVVGGVNAGSYQVTAITTTQIDVATGSFTADATSTSALYSVKINTWYHMWLIRRSDTGVVDALFSENATTPNYPTSYDQKRRIGAVLTDASANIIAFHQYGDYFYWDTLVLDFTQTSTLTTADLKVMSVPTGIQVTGLLHFGLNNSGSGNNEFILITSPDQADLAATSAFYTIVNSGNDTSDAVFIALKTDISGQIRVRAQNGGGSRTFQGMAYGWIDPRGKNE